MNLRNQTREVSENGEYAVHRSKRADIFAAVICLILAFAVWLVIMNAEDTTYLPLNMQNENAACEYTLSSGVMKVRGTVLSIKRADSITVCISSAMHEPGTYTLASENLVFPEGVQPVGDVGLILTVRAK